MIIAETLANHSLTSLRWLINLTDLMVKELMGTVQQNKGLNWL